MKIKEVYVRWIGIPILAIAINGLVKHDKPDSWILQVLISMIFTGIFWNGAYLIFQIHRRRFPEITQTPRRILSTIITLATFLLVFASVIRMVLGYVTISDIIADWTLIFDKAEINFVAAFMIGSVYESVYFFEKWKNTIEQNEALKNQQVRTQFEVLQNQMSPHFLFNSLNTLTTLIAENQNTAISFTERLSEVYRYILQNKEKELVTLEQELEFAKNYLYLLQIRYPENLHVTFDIDDQFNQSHIAPLTIQILVENCIKHNIISKTNPLNIEIYVQNGKSIVVKNNLQVKKVIEKSTKTGLVNIKKRYKYLCDQSIDVITTSQNFMVAVPLINVVESQNELIQAEA